jgi:hypothetical protein
MKIATSKPGLVAFAILCSLAMQDVLAQQRMTARDFDTSSPQVNFLGFGDITYSDADGFAIGQAVAHVAASLSSSLSVFGEFSLTARDTGYSTEAERLLVKYEFSDLFKFSTGRYHTPIGYWNSAYHHGTWLQTTVSRPRMVKFGSEIVPIHFVGALVEGKVPRNALGLSYMAGIGNGRHANIARAGDSGDINGNRAWMLQLNIQPQRYYGLNAGVGYYRDKVSPPGQPEVNEGIFSGYVAWAREAPEVIIEYVHSNHELVAQSSISGNVDAWYAQFAWRLAGAQRQWKPYVRFERDRIDPSDPLLGTRGLDYDGGIVGLRWDFDPHAALKAEYRNEEFDNGGRENSFRLQISFVVARL